MPNYNEPIRTRCEGWFTGAGLVDVIHSGEFEPPDNNASKALIKLP